MRAPLTPPSRIFDNHGYPNSIGSGSCTVVTMTDDDKKQAEEQAKQRGTFGFGRVLDEPPPPRESCASTFNPAPGKSLVQCSLRKGHAGQHFTIDGGGHAW